MFAVGVSDDFHPQIQLVMLLSVALGVVWDLVAVAAVVVAVAAAAAAAARQSTAFVLDGYSCSYFVLPRKSGMCVGGIAKL